MHKKSKQKHTTTTSTSTSLIINNSSSSIGNSSINSSNINSSCSSAWINSNISNRQHHQQQKRNINNKNTNKINGRNKISTVAAGVSTISSLTATVVTVTAKQQQWQDPKSTANGFLCFCLVALQPCFTRKSLANNTRNSSVYPPSSWFEETAPIAPMVRGASSSTVHPTLDDENSLRQRVCLMIYTYILFMFYFFTWH